MANLAQWSNSLCSSGRFACGDKEGKNRHLRIRNEISCFRKKNRFIDVERSAKWTRGALDTHCGTVDKWGESEIMPD